MSEVQHLDESNFKDITAGKLCLVDFWAEWCGPCRMLSKVLDQLAAETDDLIVKVDIDKNVNLAAEFSVSSIPMVFIIKDGKVLTRFTGVQDKATLLNALKDAKNA